MNGDCDTRPGDLDPDLDDLDDGELERCPVCDEVLGDLRPCPGCGWTGICRECRCNLGPGEVDLCDQCEFMLEAAGR